MCVILFIFQSIFVEKASFLQTSARFKPTANTSVPVGQDSNRRRTLLYLSDKIQTDSEHFCTCWTRYIGFEKASFFQTDGEHFCARWTRFKLTANISVPVGQNIQDSRRLVYFKLTASTSVPVGQDIQDSRRLVPFKLTASTSVPVGQDHFKLTANTAI